jgi:hypothetical protein
LNSANTNPCKVREITGTEQLADPHHGQLRIGNARALVRVRVALQGPVPPTVVAYH